LVELSGLNSLIFFDDSEAAPWTMTISRLCQHTTKNEEMNMQTPKDTRTAEAKRLDELALQYRTSRDPEVLAEMRAVARRLAEANQ
jgi:hypothetical protein